ncbi:MAG: hypothetical protein LBR77_05045 [Lachnospiraceae bacterium]|nr:hypothetical protein [Lachnospiraceae bacterium]
MKEVDGKRSLSRSIAFLSDFENVNYCLVDSFDGIDYARFDDVLCATPSQTFNEMLANYDNMVETIDEQSLIEGLARYYFSHGRSFDGLAIKPENLARFNFCL